MKRFQFMCQKGANLSLHFHWMLVVCLFAFLANSCTTSRYREVDELVSKGDCENASVKFVTSQHESNIAENVQTTTGEVSSYGIGALGYTADTLLVGSMGIVMIAAVCSPSLLFYAATKVNGLHCFPSVSPLGPKNDYRVSNPNSNVDTTYGFGIGDRVLSNTETWRKDPALEQFSKTIRELAICYKKRGDSPNLIKSKTQIDQLKELSTSADGSVKPASSVYARVSKMEREEIDRLSEEISGQMLKLDPDYQTKLAAEKQKQFDNLLANHAPEIWRDVKTGKFWIFQISGVASLDESIALCDHAVFENHTRWSVPTENEVLEALENGLVNPEVNTEFIRARTSKAKFYIKGIDDEAKLVDLDSGETSKKLAGVNPVVGLICVY